MRKISAVIITLNEARNISRCLRSLEGIADEVVVLDSGSTDATQELCRAHGARFFEHPFISYSDQKNRANALATHDLIFSIDADEVLSDALRAALAHLKSSPDATQTDAWQMNRMTNYCGQWIRHSGWYPDRKIRLFDRRKAAWGGPNPHEILELAEGTQVGFLHGDLLHYSYATVQEHLDKTRRYNEMSIRNLLAKGRRSNWLQVIFSPVFKFFRNYILKAGFLDGRAGFTICRIAALETYWKYRGLMRKQG